MIDLRLAHISWSIAGRDARKACDAFLLDVFGGQTAFEMQMSPDILGKGLGREETLIVVGDTMLISIAGWPGGIGADKPVEDMLAFHARDGMWIGVALHVQDLNR